MSASGQQLNSGATEARTVPENTGVAVPEEPIVIKTEETTHTTLPSVIPGTQVTQDTDNIPAELLLENLQ